MKTLAGLDYEEVLPQNGQAPKSVLFLLHGLGSNAQDLISLAPYWAAALPDTVFISPNAPFPCDMAPIGYQWFSLQNRDHEAMLAGVQDAVPRLNDFIDAHLEALGLDGSQMAAMGFSQGSMMSMYTFPRRAKPCAGIACFSGALIDDGKLVNEPDSLNKIPVFLAHGSQDDVVPFEAFHHAGENLHAAGFDVRGLECKGLGHSIDENGLQEGGAFLRQCLYGEQSA